MEWAKILIKVEKASQKLSKEYKDRLNYELIEIEKQGASDYWVDIYNKKFQNNPNGLVLPFILGICDIDPLIGESKIIIGSKTGFRYEATIIELENKRELVASRDTLIKTIDGFKRFHQLILGDNIVVDSSTMEVTKITEGRSFAKEIRNDVLEENGIIYKAGNHPIPHNIKYHPDLPDIDIDLVPEAREPLRKYAEKKFGINKICSVGSWQTYKPKLAIKDAARSMKLGDLKKINELTKSLPDEFDDMTLAEACTEFKEFNAFVIDNEELVDAAYSLVKLIKTQGRHAGGLIISSVDVHQYLPLTYRKGNWISEWTEGRSPQLSKFGFVKFDFLGLKTIQYIWNCMKTLQKDNIIINWADMDIEADCAGWVTHNNKKKVLISFKDSKALALANARLTESIFQLDTPLAKSILRNKVKTFDDIVTFISLGRPGPLPLIPEYIKRRDDEKYRIKMLNQENPEIASILEKTYGILVFQEQISTFFCKICGFTVPEAEFARKAVAKKYVDKLKALKPKIVNGAAKKLGIQIAKEWYSKIESFARYAFNLCLDQDTILIDPITKESLTIQELYDKPHDFHLLSRMENGDIIPDLVIKIHFNDFQKIYEIEFDNGVKQRTTLKHKFMNEFNEMESVESFLQTKHAVKYVDGGIINEIKQRKEKINCRVGKICGQYYIKDVKYIGIRRTYSPEMKSVQHNYITSPLLGQPIHQNSHAVAYGIIVYRSLWLKAYYPEYWWASVMSDCKIDKLSRYIRQAKTEGVKLCKLDVNSLKKTYNVIDGGIVPGLRNIKGIGINAAEKIDIDRKYETIQEFIKINGKSKIVMERLIKLGAFDSLVENRKVLWWWYKVNYCTDVDSKELKIDIKKIIAWPLFEIEKERQRQAHEYFKIYPNKKKLPPKIRNWVPITKYVGNNKHEISNLDKRWSEDIELKKTILKLQIDLPTIAEILEKDGFNIGERLKFEREWLGYYWDNPMDRFNYNEKNTLARIKNKGYGVADCLIDEAEIRNTKRGSQYVRAIVTDGKSTNTIVVWTGDFDIDFNKLLDEFFNGEVALRLHLEWNDQYESFQIDKTVSELTILEENAVKN